MKRFSQAALISLDHDLNPSPGAKTDPGTGMDVARFIGDFLPVCPVDCSLAKHGARLVHV